jgi:hypothetical protein
MPPSRYQIAGILKLKMHRNQLLRTVLPLDVLIIITAERKGPKAPRTSGIIKRSSGNIRCPMNQIDQLMAKVRTK